MLLSVPVLNVREHKVRVHQIFRDLGRHGKHLGKTGKKRFFRRRQRMCFPANELTDRKPVTGKQRIVRDLAQFLLGKRQDLRLRKRDLLHDGRVFRIDARKHSLRVFRAQILAFAQLRINEKIIQFAQKFRLAVEKSLNVRGVAESAGKGSRLLCHRVEARHIFHKRRFVSVHACEIPGIRRIHH